jgi:hypothetical protein
MVSGTILELWDENGVRNHFGRNHIIWGGKAIIFGYGKIEASGNGS